MLRLFIVCLFICNLVAAQEQSFNILDSISNTEDAKQYLSSHKKRGSKLITFNEERHKSTLAKDLFSKGNGGTIVTENEYQKTFYKIVEKNTVKHYRVSYIFLDGNLMGKEQVETFRSRILKKYNNGVTFKDLAKQYSMDNNANRGGDLGWFAKGDMHPEFEDAVINKNTSEDLFSLDIPSKRWYYLILKTHDPKPITEITVLKIVETI